MSALVALIVVCTLALSPATHRHCNQRCRRQLVEQCAKAVLDGGSCSGPQGAK